MASRTAARTATSSAARAAATATPAIAITTASAGTSLTRAFRTRCARFDRGYDSIYPVEVWLVIGVKIRAAFDHCCRSSLRRAPRNWWRCCIRSLICVCVCFRKRSSTHFGALLFQNCLPRQLDAVAFDGQHFHQHLIAFFQFIANIFDSVFGNFADVEQSVQAWQNLDERAEVGEAADFTR